MKQFLLISAILPFCSFCTQAQTTSLSFEDALLMLNSKNKDVKIAEQGIESARKQRDIMNATWYPMIGATGMYVHTSNEIAVKESLSGITNPIKDVVHEFLPNDQIISGLLDKLGSHTLTLTLLPQNMSTIDATLAWPIFTGGKRYFASRIGRSLINAAEINKQQTVSEAQTLLVERYFGLRLQKSIQDIREETLKSLEDHYRNAVALEENGMINRAELLVAQVSKDEAKRELSASNKDVAVTLEALKACIYMEESDDITTTTPLFINEEIPSLEYFKDLMQANNYLIQGLEVKQQMAKQAIKIEEAGYLPNIALMGKQTLYAHQVPKNLLPRTMVGVGFTWNIFDGLAREKKIRQAKINSYTLDLGKDKAKTDLDVGVEKLYTELQKAIDNVNALKSSLQLTVELVRIRERAFQEGMATSTEVVDAEVMLSKIKVAYMLAFYEYDVALMNLLSICGAPQEFHDFKAIGITETALISSITNNDKNNNN
ncbi:MAG: TolC family protein [Tannerellaceae bacterium]